MLFNWNASAARNNVNKYECKINRTELKFILQYVDFASQQGYTGLVWHGGIAKTNIRYLKKLGYKIHHKSQHDYVIEW